MARIDGVVLAGGYSSRMQTADVPCDKAWLRLAGVPLIEHVARNLSVQVDTLYVSTPYAEDRYRALGVPVPDDTAETDERRGPLAGVLAAMTVSTADWLAVAPCDAPFLPAGWVGRLHKAALQADAPGALVVHRGWRQPVFMVVRCELQAHLKAALAAGMRKVGQWQREVAVIEVAFDDVPDHTFLNINTPIELAQAQAIVASAQFSQRENS